MFVILGAYKGKPPSLGKGGFPFSRIFGAHRPPRSPWEINTRITRHWRWHCGPVRCRDSLRLPHSARAGILYNFVIRCDAQQCWR